MRKLIAAAIFTLAGLLNTNAQVANFLPPLGLASASSAFTCTTAGVCTLAAVPLASLATQATNTIVGNATGGTAVPTALAIATCSTAGSAVKWTTNGGFGCNTAIDAATLGSATFAAPGAIGGGTPSTGAFTTLAATTITGTGLLSITAAATPTTKISGSASGTSNFYDNMGLALIQTTNTNNNMAFISFIEANGVNGAAAIWAIIADHTSGAPKGDLVFGTNNGAGAPSEQMRLNRTGIFSLNATNYNNCTALTTVGSTVTCTVSGQQFKNEIGRVTGDEGLLAVVPAIFDYRDPKKYGSGERLGLFAQEVCSVDERLCVRGENGEAQNYDERGVIALLLASARNQKKDIEALKARKWCFAGYCL